MQTAQASRGALPKPWPCWAGRGPLSRSAQQECCTNTVSAVEADRQAHLVRA